MTLRLTSWLQPAAYGPQRQLSVSAASLMPAGTPTNSCTRSSRQLPQPWRRPAAAGRPGPAAPRQAAGLAAAMPPAAAGATAAAAPLSQLVADMAVAAVDEAPAWTLDQAVGLVFGGLLLLLYLSSTQVDAYVARQQRRQLGLCEECGGLFEPGTCAEKNCPARRPQ